MTNDSRIALKNVLTAVAMGEITENAALSRIDSLLAHDHAEDENARLYREEVEKRLSQPPIGIREG